MKFDKLSNRQDVRGSYTMTMVYRPRPCAVPRTPGTTARGRRSRSSLARCERHCREPIEFCLLFLRRPSSKWSFFFRNKAKCCRCSTGVSPVVLCRTWIRQPSLTGGSRSLGLLDRSMLCLFHSYEHDWIEC
jgi:hypothetical protein